MTKLKEKIIKWWNTSSKTQYIGGRSAIVYTYYGKFHRDNGPAIIYDDCSFEYYKNGQLHREDGPAKQCMISFQLIALAKAYNYPYKHEYQEYYYNGTKIECKSDEEFKKKIKLLAFL